MAILHSIIRRYRNDGFDGMAQAVKEHFFRRFPHVHPVAVALEEVIRNDDYTIIQLGAHEGNTANDPIFSTIKRFSARRSPEAGQRNMLILVEPVKHHFEKLRTNYANIPGTHFENVAVASESGKATLYQLDVDPVAYGYPEWLSQLSSLKEDRINQLVNEDIKQFYLNNRISYEVDCIDFGSLMKRYSIRTIDLLQIDIEGYEYELLSAIDFFSVPIRFINYESEVMFGNRLKCKRLLQDHGYCTIDYEQDTFCFRRPDRQLIKRGVYNRRSVQKHL